MRPRSTGIIIGYPLTSRLPLQIVALARPPPFPVARRRRGWWRRRAFALVRAFVEVAAAAKTVGRNVRE
eukprot:scaffold2148_cov394-Pavlova_lutheri.AAC.1